MAVEDLGLDEVLYDTAFTTTFTWSGGTYTGAIGHRTDSKELAPGGYGLGEDQELVCPTDQFTSSRPVAEQTVVVSSQTLRIESVATSPCNTFLVLRLKNDSRGA